MWDSVLLSLLAATPVLSLPERRGAPPTCSSQPPSVVSSTLAEYNLTTSVFNATFLATIYGFPLASYANVLSEMNLFEAGVNTLVSTGALSAVQDTSVVRENIDTVYVTAALDFSSTDVELYVPPYTPDRFISFTFYDPFAFIWSDLGSFANNQTGKYLLQSPASNITTCPSCYVGCIQSPTYDGLLQARIEAKNNNTDLVTVDAYIKNTTMGPVGPKYDTGVPPLSPADFANLPANNISDILTLVARLWLRNLPETPQLAADLPAVFAYAGINVLDGTYTSQPGVNLTLVEYALVEFLSAPHTDYYVPLTNSWLALNPAWYGTYDDGSLLYNRAYTSYAGYLGNKPDTAIYPVPGLPPYNLTTTESYLVTFYGIPPVDYMAGFWSLTLYGSTNFLIPNPENVYGLGNHYNLTYPDGTVIYTPAGGVANPARANDTFQILIQAGNVMPPANWTSNFLPGPVGGGTTYVQMRLYNPEASASNGGYKYPDLTKISAITG